MNYGFLRVSALTPDIEVANCDFNTKNIMAMMDEAYHRQTKIAVFPEMCITGYTCNDLFLNELLIDQALEHLQIIARHSSKLKGMVVFVGLPFEYLGKLYNVAAAVLDGKILCLVPKKFLPNYGEFYERRQFTSGFTDCVEVTIGESKVPFGGKILLRCLNMPQLIIGTEICEDLWNMNPPSNDLAYHGATVLVNLSASNETIGKRKYREDLVKGQSARLICGYIYSSAGEGESTQDLVFSGHNLICENGTKLAESITFENEAIYADLDLDKLRAERRKISTMEILDAKSAGYVVVDFKTKIEALDLLRIYERTPFVPTDSKEKNERCEEILNIQTYGLKKRLKHTRCQSAVIGLSGGLDSTLALIVTVRAFDLLKIDRSCITCVTMPCFGTTDRTYNNAVTLAHKLGTTLREINISTAVRQHFKDIEHDESIHNVTYENGQARERTQILMDIANQTNGMVIGTGDMSELALGWATYNGDHMSMYGVNSSVPKTLVRHLVRYYADICANNELSDVLLDILDTPVSPELLPPEKDGTIAQKTEDLVGPYELHDFFLYHMLRFGVRPAKLFKISCKTFEGMYDQQTIYKWLRTFIWRFFAQQFKRSCLPDGPKVGSVAVSPRGDLRMPSDASSALWMTELDQIKAEYHLD